MHPKVSVILPFYNAEKTLASAIQSIVNQSFIDFELLLIDNASTDSGLSIAQEFESVDSRISIHSEPNRGVVFAANKGLSLATGEYIARMDADDYSYLNRLEKQVQLLDSNDDIGLVSGLVDYKGSIENEGFIRYVDWSNGIVTHEAITLNQFVEFPIVNPTIMFRRSLYKEHGGYLDGDFPEDYEFFLRLQAVRIKMEKVATKVIEWNDLPNRLTRTDDKYSQEAFFRVKAKYLSEWLSKQNPKHPDVIIWGAGRHAKKRSSFLKQYGININGHIDLKESSPSSIYFKDLDSFKNSFILSFVTSWDARDEIRAFLNTNGFKEGVNYLICA